MKKLLIIALLFVGVLTVRAQEDYRMHQINSFFDSKGGVAFRLQTQELEKASDTLATVFHRLDDVVWARVVYRVIDMRYKQNFQLYFPTNAKDPQYRSLFKLIADAAVNGLPIYPKAPSIDQGGIKPTFNNVDPETGELQGPKELEGIPGLFEIENENGYYTCLTYDSLTQTLSFDHATYDIIAKNQLKYMIQEIVFFDKHYSRMFSKIMAIAPMNSDKADQGDDLMNALYNEIMFWIVYDDLRPYMARQEIMPQANDVKHVTFEEFFAKKYYHSYLIGDSNMYDRMFGDFATKAAKRPSAKKEEAIEEEDEEMDEEENFDEENFDEEEEEAAPAEPEVDLEKEAEKARVEKILKREQQRVEDELLNFELDLWEY